MGRKSIILGSIIAVLTIGIFGYFLNKPQQTLQREETAQVQGEKIEAVPDEFSYTGEDGVDALTLLKNNTNVEEENGFVTSIHGREADDSKQEFWAFYVNGEMAQVGAGEYLTNDSDVIEWKIETY